jgi:hypothetical protein
MIEQQNQINAQHEQRMLAHQQNVMQQQQMQI